MSFVDAAGDPEDQGFIEETAALESDIAVVNGSAFGGADDQYATATPVGGNLTFTVNSNGFEDYVAVVFFDEDGDTRLDLDSDGVPTDDELFGVSGVVSVLPQEAAFGGPANDADIEGLDKDGDWIVANDTTAGVTRLFEYDDNDTFFVDDATTGNTAGACVAAEEVTLADFEDVLTVGDDLDSVGTVYQPNDALGSSFCLLNTSPAQPTLAATGAQESVELSIAGLVTGYDEVTVTRYAATDADSGGAGGTDNTACTTDDVYSATGEEFTLTAADDEDDDVTGIQYTDTDATNAGTDAGCYYYEATQTVDGEESDASAADTATAAADADPTFVSARANDVNDGVGTSNQVRFTFSETVVVNDATGFTVIEEASGIEFNGLTATVSGSTVIVTLDGTLNDAGTDNEYDITIDAAAVEDAAGNEIAAVDVDTTSTTVHAFTY
ncbi:MAG: Ig-like domain-containing protein [Nitriliruptor sp.]|uniref:Ig-like domain-containing protein n=1 Tax=Nitriliruptor sp. TaxID=2448056 RepID=UPI0034A01C63